MAARLELRFHSPALLQGETMFVGRQFTFTNNRVYPGQVSIIPNYPYIVGANFFDAFAQDVNYGREYTVTSYIEQQNEYLDQSHYIMTITHPDNNHFDNFQNNTSFIGDEITIIPDDGGGGTEPTEFTAEVQESDSTPCENYDLVVESSAERYIRIDFPIGHEIQAQAIAAGTPVTLNFPRPQGAGTGRVRLYDTVQSSRVIATREFVAPRRVTIQGVQVESTPFGASALIQAVGPDDLEYSIDGQEWAKDPQYFELNAGSYTASVRDTFGCVKTRTFNVSQDQVSGLEVEPFIRVPIHNSIHFADRKQDNFLGRLGCGYMQQYIRGDKVVTQFKSSYRNNRAYLIDENLEETEVAVVRKSDNINRESILQGNYKNVDGRLAVFFTGGETPGALPIWYNRGVYLNIEGIGPTQIERIVHDKDDDIIYAVTMLDGSGSANNINITSIHSAHPYEVYEFEIQFLSLGVHQIRIDYDRYGLGNLIKGVGNVSPSPNNNLASLSLQEPIQNGDVINFTMKADLRRERFEVPGIGTFTQSDSNSGTFTWSGVWSGGATSSLNVNQWSGTGESSIEWIVLTKDNEGNRASFLSEMININRSLPKDEFKQVFWYSERNNDILYSTGIKHMRRLEIEKDFTPIPRTEKETYPTDTSIELISASTFGVYNLTFAAMPMELARGLQVGIDISEAVEVEGIAFVSESPATLEDMQPYQVVTAELTLTDQSKTIKDSIRYVEPDYVIPGYVFPN